jgi:hypothetical protein
MILPKEAFMRKLFLSTAALGWLVLAISPIQASPFLNGATAAPAVLNEGVVQKVHGRHCKQKKGWYRGKRQWHQHRQACRDYYESRRRYPPRPYYGYGEYGFPYNEWYWERRNWLWD